MNIADLKRRKKALKLTTTDLAYLAELPVGTVSKVMTGETKNPTNITVEKINAALLKKEMESRINAYCIAMSDYIREHSDEEFDPVQFDRLYREEHDLDDAPIPYATSNVLDRNVVKALDHAPDGRISVDEFIKIAECSDAKLELLDGHLIMNDAASFKHQLIVQNIGNVITKYILENGGPCRLFNVGLNTRHPSDNHTLLIPDLVIACNPELFDETGIAGAPDLIMEFTSPGSKNRDYKEKRLKYMEWGVREYWIVDLQKEIVTVYLSEEPDITHVYSFDDDIPVGIYEGKLTVKINDNTGW